MLILYVRGSVSLFFKSPGYSLVALRKMLVLSMLFENSIRDNTDAPLRDIILFRKLIAQVKKSVGIWGKYNAAELIGEELRNFD